jgi:hypothetical protein
VVGGDQRAHRRSERTGERGRRALDHRDLEPGCAGGRGDLGTDESTADDHEPTTARQVLAQRAGVVERAQHVDAVQAVAAGESAGGRSGGHDHPVGTDCTAVREPYRALGAVEPDGAGAEQPLRVQLLAVPLEHEVGLPHLTGEELLGQRRPAVGAVSLITDDDEPSVKTLRA